MADDLSEDGIARALRGRFGRPLAFFDSIGSTNTFALAWAAEGAPEGAIVVADHQTEGRGRRERRWLSQPGKLLQFSVILRPKTSAAQLGLLPTALALACADAVEDVAALATAVKWPNDVTVEGRKLAGILVETRVSGSKVEAVVAGVGVNVGWRRDEVPDEVAEAATSIAIEVERRDAGSVPARELLLARILLGLEELYPLATDPKGAADLVERATRRSQVLGRNVVIRWPDGTSTEARPLRLLSSGSLECEIEGSPVELHAAEIEQIRAR